MQTFSGYEYLMIDVANQWGLDKQNWDKRLKFCNRNYNELWDLEETANDRILYRKALRALEAASRGEAIGHAMSLDATTSVLQILSALTGCDVTANNVNTGNTGNRENFYGKAANKMSQLTGEMFTSDDLKKPVMTTYYGSKAQPKKMFGEGTPELIAFYQMLLQETPGPFQAMQLIQSMWNPEALSYQWVMPDKHVVNMQVTGVVDKKIEIDELNHATFTHRATVPMKLDKGLSLAANITHSVDGYIVREMVRRAHRSNFQLATIHDSFWAHPNHMNQVRKLYVQILAEIAKSNLLESILNQINPGWGTIGKQDISDLILDSEYALS